MQNNKIKILHIIKSLGRGGAETLLPETLYEHDKEKFEFHYIYFLPWKDQLVSAIKDNGGIVHCFEAKNNLSIILQASRIAKYIKENGIQLIHCHLPWAGVVGRFAGKLAKVPVIYTEHNKWERYHKLTFALNKYTFSMQKKVIAVSEDVANSIKGFYKKPEPEIEVVLNGVNLDKYSRALNEFSGFKESMGIASDKIIIGTVAVFRFQKRITLWLEIAAKIHSQHPNTYFIIVGDGPLKQEIYEKAKELKMEAYLHFAGLQTEVRPYLKAMDIFMMSSEFEGLPIALLEAMSMECIPACTDAGGIPEVINDMKDGILVPVDKPFELVDKLSALTNNWSLAENLKKAAREKIKKEYSIKRMSSELETIYKSLSKISR